MNSIYALTDYKNYFGSKWKSMPYKSGFDKDLITKYLHYYNYNINFISLNDVSFNNNLLKEKVVIYTSSEEYGYHYKNFIEDIIFGLVQYGSKVVPHYSFLRAHNNKVFMEILRDRLLGKKYSGNKSNVYGTLEELERDIDKNKMSYPCVIKSSAGAMSRGVFLANNENELKKIVKKISRTPHFIYEIKEIMREYKHKDYKKESKYQSKFIIQPFIPGLKNDWKILIFGDHYYILKRGIKGNDFRASGSHHEYKAGSEAEFPIHKLDLIKEIYEKLDVPHLSLDVAYDGSRIYIHEFQAVYFGTSTHEFCDGYYTKKGDKWVFKKKELDQEGEYVWGLVHYFRRNPELFK